MFKKFAQFGRLFLRSLKEFFQASPAYAMILFILIPIQAVLPALIIGGSQALLTALSSHQAIVWPVTIWGVTIILLGITGPIVTLSQGLLTDQLVAHINLTLMKHSQKLKGIATFETASYYDEMEFIRSEASWRPVNLIVFGLDLIRGIITTIAYVVLLLQFQWPIILLIIIPAIPQALITYRIQQDAFETMVDRSPESRKMQYYAQTLLANTDAKEVRLFNAFDFFINRYQTTFKKIHYTLRKVRFRQMWIATLFTGITALAILASLGLVINGIQSQVYAVAALLTFSATVVSLTSTLNNLVEGTNMLYDTLLFMQKFYDFLDRSDPMNDGQVKLETAPISIAFDHVTFQYPETDHDTLHDLSFTIHAGEKIAIVGENGSGKSTLVKLMLRLYDVSGGQININQQPLTHLDLADYRQHVRVVFQDFSKFYLTLKDSVGIADLTSDSDQMVQDALKQASAWDNFQKQGLSLSTQLGKQFDGGVELSGGQWQKIAIARGFMHGSTANLAILDEPTAAIDPRSEFEIYQQFANLSANKTVIFVTHRLSSVTMADRVLFMQNGRISGFDTHQHLMQQNNDYAQMYRMQADAYVKGLSSQ